MTRQSFAHLFRARVFELVAVFLGVALAFLADDWRDFRAERREERAALVSLREDLQSNREELEARLSFQQRALTSTSAIMSLLDSADYGAGVPVPDSLLIAFVTGATYEPARGTIDALVQGARLTLIRDPELRSRVAAWPARYDDVNRLQLLQRDLVHAEIGPVLAESGVDLGRHWLENRPVRRGEVPEDLKASSTSVPATARVRSIVGQRVHIARQVEATLRSLRDYDLGLLELVNRSLIGG